MIHPILELKIIVQGDLVLQPYVTPTATLIFTRIPMKKHMLWEVAMMEINYQRILKIRQYTILVEFLNFLKNFWWDFLKCINQDARNGPCKELAEDTEVVYMC